MVDIGPRQENLLTAWEATASTTAAGDHHDFTPPSRTDRLQDRLSAFKDSPGEETFATLWTSEVIRNATYGGSRAVVNNWHGSLDELAEFIADIQAADSYNSAWERQFPEFLKPGLWELYGRFNPNDRPILTSWTRKALPIFGLKNPRSYADAREQMETFREIYFQYVGHATAGTDHETPIYAEMEQFLHLTATLDEAELRNTLGMDTPEYGAFAGWDAMQAHGQPIELTDLRPVLDAFTTAANEEAYADDDQLDHWGANHWETWKDDYHQYLVDEVFSDYDPTALTAADVAPFIDALGVARPLDHVTPIYLLGGRWQPWDSFETISKADPEEAAAVLSSLLDEESGPLPERLRQFDAFYRDVADSGSERMSLATMLLMLVHPDQYAMYRYSMFTEFFDAFSTYEIPTGYNPSVYVLLNDALERVRADLDTYVEESVRMFDVHSLLWVYQENGHPSSAASN